MLDLTGRGERIRTSDLTVPKSVTAQLPLILTYYTVVCLQFYLPFRMVLFRASMLCDSVRELDLMAHFPAQRTIMSHSTPLAGSLIFYCESFRATSNIRESKNKKALGVAETTTNLASQRKGK